MALTIFAAGQFDTNSSFSPLVSVMDWSGTANFVEAVSPVDGVLQQLHYFNAAAPGAGKSRSLIARINGSGTSLVATVVDTDTWGSDIVNTAAITAGQPVGGAGTTVGSPAVVATKCAVELNATDNKESGYISGRVSQTTAQAWFGCFFVRGSSGAHEDVDEIVPLAGAITGLYVDTNGSVSGGTWTYYLLVNGVKQDGTGGTTDTSLAVTGAGPWSRTDYAVSVSVGDKVSWQRDVSSTPVVAGGTPAMFQGTRFKANQPHKAILAGGSVNSVTSPQNTANNFVNPSTFNAWVSSDGSATTPSGSAKTISGLRVWIPGTSPSGPGIGKSYTFTFLKNTVDQALAVSFTGTDVSKSDLTNSVAYAVGDFWTVRSTPASTPTAEPYYWTAVISTSGGGVPAGKGPGGHGKKGGGGALAIQQPGGAAVFNIGNAGLDIGST